MSVTNEEHVGLPPLSAKRKSTWDYYRIEFLHDGYPGRRVGDVVQPHPIYGPYVINDYLGQYRLKGDPTYLQAAQRVAEAALSRMVGYQGAQIFRYTPDTGLSSLSNEFYSGLTQARYLSSLGRLEEALGCKPFRDATLGVLRSLRIPALDGGVARRTPSGGLLIEEYAHAVPDYTLNGWTTATLLVHEYAVATQDPEAFALFTESVAGIEDVLPLYDAGELLNSRYRLTGPTKVRLTFTEPGAMLAGGSVVIPGQGDFPLGANGGKWTNRVLTGVAEDRSVIDRRATLEVLVSRVSWPVPNRIKIEIHASDQPGTMSVQLGIGPYNPTKVQAVVDEYRTLAEVSLEAGSNTLDIPIPWAIADISAYPTSFTKLIEGQRRNMYHFIHIDTLDRLAKITGSDLFAYYRDRWSMFSQRWAELPVYREAEISLERFK